MKLILTLLSFFILALNCFSQNLVKNYSFENYNYTVCDITELFNPIFDEWDSPNSSGGGVYSTTIGQTCYYFQPNSTYDGPISFKGTETPSEGNIFVGIWIYTINGFEDREYIRGELNSPMEAGLTYRVKFKISLADFMESYVGELGIAFTETTSIPLDNQLVLTEPQITINSGLDKREGWTEFETTFVSDGNYNYFIIGNFKSDADTETFDNPGASGEPSTYGAYYYIDEVVIELDGATSSKELKPFQIEIFPSIVTENLTFNLKEHNLNQFNIVNQFGQIIQVEKVNSRTTGFISCESLAAGVYYLIGQDKNSLVRSTTKFIKVD